METEKSSLPRYDKSECMNKEGWRFCDFLAIIVAAELQ